ncbi:MAG: hypothetical protein HOA81_00285 [Opitutales bacterium]|nr:hypothetical protein [Opitutales bacterium]
MAPHVSPNRKILKHKEGIRKRMWKTLPKTVQAKKRFSYAGLRVTAITFAGIKENRLLNRAAALSFSSLIGLIPMIAIIILVSGFALEKSDPDLVINNIRKSISYIAPHLSGLDTDACKELAKISKPPFNSSTLAKRGFATYIAFSLFHPKKANPSRTTSTKPLDQIELSVFKSQFDNHGKNPHENHFDEFDPIVKRFHNLIEQVHKTPFNHLTIEDIIELDDDSTSIPSPNLDDPSTLA